MCYLKTCHCSRKSQLTPVVFHNTLFLTKLLLCTILRFLRTTDIDFLGAFYTETEQLGTVIDHLNKSAAHSKNMCISICILKTHLTWNNGCYHIRMMSKKALLACQGLPSINTDKIRASIFLSVTVCPPQGFPAVFFLYTVAVSDINIK